ncbi:MAG TPA: polysaccharide biosynthesis/export family protein [Amaricoccus sp.]|nr:polysaccharide biosynthesis/export family protein [Amaricoccus sp.]
MIRRGPLLALLIAAAPAAAGEYRLQPGDVIELVVVSPPIREALAVDLDGRVTLPLAGPVAAEGRTLAELTAEARKRLAAATLPPGPGEAIPTPIWPDAVSLTVRSYRPVWVGGEVRAPGAFPFAPGLTARRSILLAGGPGLLPDGGLRRLELEGALAGLEVRRAATAARLARLRAEIDAASPELPEPELPEPERAILLHRRTEDASAEAYFAAAIRHTRAQIAELSARLAAETEGVAADRADFDRIEEMREAGTATALRLSDTRRALLFSTTRQLETATELARATRDLGSVEYEALRRSLDRRLDTLIEAADAARLLGELDAGIAASRRQIARLGGAGLAPTIVVTASGGEATTLGPGGDKALHPGDLVTVSLPADPAAD